MFWLKFAAHWSGHEIPAGKLLTLPVAGPTTVTVNGTTGTKVAVTDCAEFMVTLQAPIPAQEAALQPANPDPAAGDAVRVTTVPLP